MPEFAAAITELWRKTSQENAQSSTPHHRGLAETAAGQFGVVTRVQLVDAGFGSTTIARRVADGRLHRLYRGVYAVGHAALRPEGHRLAAVLACGEGALLFRRSAAAAWDVRADNRTRIEVAVPHPLRRAPPGVDVHRARLTAADVSTHDHLPLTSPARTLADLAGVLSRGALAKAVDRAIVLRLYDQNAMNDVIERGRGRRGTAALRDVLDTRHPQRERTRSDLEILMLDLIDAARIPRPQVNVWLPDHTLEVDLLWPAQRVVVELDGRAHHLTPAAFEADRRRDADLEAAGYVVLRFTHRQVTTDPGWVVARLTTVLAARAAR